MTDMLHALFRLGKWPSASFSKAVYVSRVQTTCFPLQEGVGGKCMKCPNDASRRQTDARGLVGPVGPIGPIHLAAPVTI